MPCRAAQHTPGPSCQSHSVNTHHWTNSGRHCTLHTAHCVTLHTAHCTLHTAHCTLHTAHGTLHTAHCTLHTAHGTQTRRLGLIAAGAVPIDPKKVQAVTNWPAPKDAHQLRYFLGLTHYFRTPPELLLTRCPCPCHTQPRSAVCTRATLRATATATASARLSGTCGWRAAQWRP
jgi:hypothetical protein